MPWVKVDEAFYDHPKFQERTAAEIGLWLLGLAYSNRYLTDGRITRRALRRLYPDDEAENLAGLLVSAGLWETAEDGWLVHDYHDFQPSSEQIKAERRDKSQAGRKGAEKRWGAAPDADRRPGTPGDPTPVADGTRSDAIDGTRDGTCDSTSHSSSNGKSDAPSRPVPSRPSSELLSSSDRGSGGPTTTDVIHRNRAMTACDLAGERRYEAAANEGKIHATSPRARRSFLRSCQRNAWAELGDLAVDIAQANPDWTTEAIADELDRREFGTVDTPPPIEYPTCPHCGCEHDLRSMCHKDPNYVPPWQRAEP